MGDPADLHAMGFEVFLRSDRSIADLGVSSLRHSLEISALQADEIDAIIFCTSTSTDRFSAFQSELESRLRAIQVRRANLFLLSFGRCSNVALALQLAQNLISLSQARRIAIITADKHAPELGPRNSQNNTQVMSDAAASCIAGENVGRFKVGRILRRSDLNITTDTLIGTTSERIDAYGNYHKLIRDLRVEYGSYLPDTLVTHNMAIPSIRSMAKEFDVPLECLVEYNVSRVGHAFCADGLINLQSCISRLSTTFQVHRVVMLLTGINTHSVVQIDVQPGSSREMNF